MRMYYGGVSLAALGLAIWYSVVLARADAYFRAGDAAKALRIAPRNTEYLALRALQLEYDGADSTALLERAAALNPMASAPRIKLGLAAEFRGDSSAEKWLLQAAQVDHQFEPRWTLANFYFRAGNTQQFWLWMHAALSVSYGDRTPAFALCWKVSDDATEILSRAIPDAHDVDAAYLAFLAQTKRWDAVTPVARRVAAFHDAGDIPLFYGVCDELIAARHPASVDLWTLAGHGAPSGIVNGDFAAPLNHGFDWRIVESPGVSHIALSVPPGLRISLNGKQADQCLLLRQTLRTAPGTLYQLSFEKISLAGVAWMIDGKPVAADGSFLASGDFTELQLAYQRPLGEPRAEGTIELRHVQVTP